MTIFVGSATSDAYLKKLRRTFSQLEGSAALID
jgi:hypothetical protein